MPVKDARTLYYEREIYQIELELQRREIQKIKREFEELQQSYMELYEFTPVGYFTFDKKGWIIETNSAGSRLLGVEKEKLVKRTFPLFVSKEDRRSFYSYFKRVFKSKKRQICELKMVKEDGTSFLARIEGISIMDKEGNYTQCRCAIIQESGTKDTGIETSEIVDNKMA